MTITRRDLLAGTAAVMASSSLPPAFAAPPPREAEIAVIGAGAAGTAAARRIAAAGRKVVVIEAASHIGGRCVTDATSFDAPFDRGGRWLYNADSSPIAKLARGVGMEMYPAPRGQRIRIGRRNARAGEAEDFLATLVRANRAMGDAVRGKADMPAAAGLPKDLGVWAGTTDFLLGAMATGKDLKDLSTLDLVTMAQRDGPSACRQGLGALVAKLGEGLPLILSTPVTRIVWSGRDAQIETTAGTLTAKAVIMTASTNALLSGKIKFAPDLPKRQQDAASKLTLGSYDHIALELPGNPLGLSRDDIVIEQSSDRSTGLLLANLGGSSLCQVDVAGSFGAELSARGEAAMVAFATEWLTKLFGSDIKNIVKRTMATRWNDMPHIYGAMSAASPGGQPARKVLMEPLGSLFFAGEAAHETQWGTVGGAWESGERAAEAALRKIGALKDAPVAEQAKKSRRSQSRATAEPAAPTRRSMNWPRN
ncbi:FAD-dependent oxidoreductase [Bradyrhizobium sp. G127]|uniref:flavin monoamine oxidase family protein n=1 Tax=Bradyrhizobium sp. G127 TaxID=2904800 RepID=UPI001F378FD2|nr:FAD-dependent oxidoreductase [Bradyrhizobium sp. G127]MCF2521242.1 FAD-dependent oxidoreductase [Bradyrhizobium sp. G127]